MLLFSVSLFVVSLLELGRHQVPLLQFPSLWITGATVSMKIVFFSSDLMFQSRVSSVVRQGGNELIVVRSIEMLRERSLADTELRIAVLDLSLKSIDLNDVIGALKNDYPAITVVAYGAHVDVEALENAQRAGADIVLTRGQFDRDMARILSVEPDTRQ